MAPRCVRARDRAAARRVSQRTRACAAGRPAPGPRVPGGGMARTGFLASRRPGPRIPAGALPWRAAGSRTGRLLRPGAEPWAWLRARHRPGRRRRGTGRVPHAAARPVSRPDGPGAGRDRRSLPGRAAAGGVMGTGAARTVPAGPVPAAARTRRRTPRHRPATTPRAPRARRARRSPDRRAAASSRAARTRPAASLRPPGQPARTFGHPAGSSASPAASPGSLASSSARRPGTHGPVTRRRSMPTPTGC